MKKEKVPFFTSFYRSQITSATATATDFLVTIFLTEITGIWYVISNSIGAVSGAVVSFLLSRNWAFSRKEEKFWGQAIRYALVSLMSLVLNTTGVYLLTEYGGLVYIYAKVIVAVAVGAGFNFFLFRYFVFK